MPHQSAARGEPFVGTTAPAVGPPEAAPTSPKRAAGVYELFMLVLCVLALVALAAEAVIPMDRESRRILAFVDNGVCGVFLVDFLGNLIRAPNRWQYFSTWGWVDLLSSIPSVDFLRWGRAARIVRVLRLFRGLRASRVLVSLIMRRRAESAVLGAVLLCLILVTLSAIGVLYVEGRVVGSNIHSAEDALWWAIATVSTVGYGDLFPITLEGRMIGAVLMTAGVGLFATFSGSVAASFLSSERRGEASEMEGLRRELRDLRQMLERDAKK